MSKFAGIPVGGTYSSRKIERDFVPVRTCWQGEGSLRFFVQKGRPKAIALKPSDTEAGCFDIVVEVWLSRDERVKRRRNKLFTQLANDAIPVAEEALRNSFAPEPAQCAAMC